MKIEIGAILTLASGERYVTASKTNYDDKIYLCLIKENDIKKVRFGYIDTKNIVFVKKENIDRKILEQLYKEAEKFIGKYS